MQETLKLLVVCSLMTSLITEALKKTLEETKVNYSKTLLAAVVSIVVAGAISVGYIILNSIQMSSQIVVYIICLIVLTWLCATLGYDTVKKTITQLTDRKDDAS